MKDTVVVAERRLSALDQKLLPSIRESVSGCERRLVAAEAKMKLLDPNNPLKRGYTLTFDADGAIVRSVSAVRQGDVLTTRFADGEIVSSVCRHR